MTGKIKIGISSCLLGEKVRYDGQHKLDRFLRDTLGQYVDWVSVCPETGCGLPVPREAMHLAGTPAEHRLVTVKTGIDHTEKMRNWAEEKLNDLETLNLRGFVFKSKSPSSGMRDVKIYAKNGIPSSKGPGIFAGMFIKRFPLIPVEDEGRLHDLPLRENFLERVFVYHRWLEELAEPSPGKLVEFHSRHKLLIMAHSPEKLKELGRIASGKKRAGLYADYLVLLMDTLKLKATVKKNVNVLQHVAGYFKKQLEPDEKAELLELIDNYHKGLLPLIVPVTLLKHYVRKYEEPYLSKQYYLDPHPLELCLRNHA